MIPQEELKVCRGCHCLSARRKARTITRIFDEHLRPHGLRATQFSVLAALTLMGPTPITRLADMLGLDRTTLTRSANLLERNGWVRSVRNGDARQHRLQVTVPGRKRLEKAFPAWKTAQAITG